MVHHSEMDQKWSIQTAPATGPLAQAARWIRKQDVSSVAVIGFLFLLINSIATIWRSIHEPRTVAFVAFSNVDIVLLYLCMDRFESASPKGKEALKVAVWILATMLTGLFCNRVAGIMPPVMAGVVWSMAAVSISGSFYALFVYKEAVLTPGEKV